MQVRVALVTYSDAATVEFNLNTYSSNKLGAHNAMRLAHKGGYTNAQEALRLVHETLFTTANGDRTAVPNKGLFVSDGFSNINQDNTVPQAGQAKGKGIEMYAVGLGANPNLIELNAIASSPESTHVFRLADKEQVRALAQQIMEEQLCT